MPFDDDDNPSMREMAAWRRAHPAPVERIVIYTDDLPRDEIIADAQAAGLIVCTCTRVYSTEDAHAPSTLVINPDCAIHAGRCSHWNCNHRHY